MEVAKSRYKINKRLIKQSKLRKPALLLATLLVLVSGSGYGYFALSKQPPVLSLTVKELVPRQPDEIVMPWLGSGQAAIGSVEDGVLAVSSSAEQPKPIASMAKVITALAVLNKAPEAVNYTITAEDEGYYKDYLAKGGSVVPVKAGQVLSRTEVFEALLLVSANNLADSLVAWHFSSMQEFTEYANQMVKGYGLTHTVVSDASGFSPQTQSTASDMIVIAQKAMAKPEIANIVAMREASIPGSGVVHNTNRLLSESGVIGIKTGTTDEAGNCLLFAASHSLPSGKKITMLGVVMGAPNASAIYTNAKSLLATESANYGAVEVVPAGTEVGSYSSRWGQTTKLVTLAPLSVETWKGKLLEPKLQMNETNNPAPANTAVGQIKIGEVAVDVVTDKTIGQPSNLWRLANYW